MIICLSVAKTVKKSYTNRLSSTEGSIGLMLCGRQMQDDNDVSPSGQNNRIFTHILLAKNKSDPTSINVESENTLTSQ